MTNIFNSNPVAMPNVCYNTRPSDKEGLEDPGDVLSKQVAGSHYKRAIQPWEIIDEWDMCYYAGNILKYLLRYKYKNGVEDLEKAKHYLEYLIKKEKDAAATRD
jgi:hypothetical protein